MNPNLQTSRDLRRTNRQHVLSLLYFNEGITRQELSRLSGLSPASVTNLVGDLLNSGLVIEAGLQESQGGRPRTTLMMNRDYGFFLGADVGETHVCVELFDIKLQSLDHIRIEVSAHENQPSQIIDPLVQGIHQLLTNAAITEDHIIGLGIGVPGVVDRFTGVSIVAPNWGWQNVPLLDLLKQHLNMPIQIDNGAQAMALAEMWFGAGQGLQNLVVVLIGTGVGAGIITQGELYRGVSNSAGEWGHTCIEIHGRTCRCGSKGCVEAYVGAPNIIARLRELSPHSPILQQAKQQTTIQALQQAAQEGDPDARHVLSETAEYLGAGIANLINLFNPELIAIGGWEGMVLGDYLLPEIQQSAQRHALAQPMSAVHIELSQLGWDAVSLGAASLAVQVFLTESLR
jgi:glucokinase-like ROK family protein